MLEAEVRLKDAYRLHRRTWVEPIEQIIAEAPGRWSRHRHYEFLYIPFSGYGINISHDETDAAETQRRPSADEAGLASLRRLRDWLRWSTTIRRKLTAAALQRTPTEDVNGTSWKLLASERRTPFNEMEYHLPPDAGLAVFKEVIAYIEAQRRDVFFPIEVRKTAGDQSWLSPFQGGPRVSIAVHAQAGEDHSWFFDGVEPMFRAASGRPHWGKLHSLAAEDLAALYPDFERFTALRRELDPEWALHDTRSGAVLGGDLMGDKQTNARDGYYEGLQRALKADGVYQPVLIVDLNRLNHNIDTMLGHLPAGMSYRIVAKSLPSPKLLAHIRARTGTNRLMTFNLPMLLDVAQAMPDADQMLGKPLPAAALKDFLARVPEPSAQNVSWLIDTPERLKAYDAASEETGQPIKIVLELDVGLHRGGFEIDDALHGTLSLLQRSNRLTFTGFMGYEPHIASIPKALKWRDQALQGAWDIYSQAVAMARPRASWAQALWTGCYATQVVAQPIAFTAIPG